MFEQSSLMLYCFNKWCNFLPIQWTDDENEKKKSYADFYVPVML